MKQTAVEFLIDEISCRFVISEELRIAMYKAIAMEKEQIIDAVQFYTVQWIDAEQYYNKNFKSE